MTTQTLTMYQGEDFAQQLSFYLDLAQSEPMPFGNPVMDVRNGSRLLARFAAAVDPSETVPGLAETPRDGVLNLTMFWNYTERIKAGTYPLDIFADVDGGRVAIVKRGLLQLVVTARITQDEYPAL